VTAPILVTGASGNVGGATVAALRARDAAIRAPARAAFDFDRPETFAATFAGVRRMLLVRPPAISDARRLRPALEAARAAGVEHVVFLSLLGVEHNPVVPHFRVERLVRALGFAFTFLRPSFFMQNLSTTHADDIRAGGEIVVPAGRGATSFIDARDVGAVAALALTEPGHEGRAYPLTGAEALTYDQVARILTEELGRPIVYRDPSMLRFVRHMRARGAAWPFIAVMLGIYGVAKLGRAGTITDDVARLLGRPPIGLRAFVRDHRDAWR
jgi:uncharacterized protein YbjT (DUF2867 family)